MTPKSANAQMLLMDEKTVQAQEPLDPEVSVIRNTSWFWSHKVSHRFEARGNKLFLGLDGTTLT